MYKKNLLFCGAVAIRGGRKQLGFEWNWSYKDASIKVDRSELFWLFFVRQNFSFRRS